MAWSSDEDDLPGLRLPRPSVPTLSQPQATPNPHLNTSPKLTAEFFLKQTSPALQQEDLSSGSETELERDRFLTKQKQFSSVVKTADSSVASKPKSSPKALVESWLRETREAVKREKRKRKQLLSDSDSDTDVEAQNVSDDKLGFQNRSKSESAAKAHILNEAPNGSSEGASAPTSHIAPQPQGQSQSHACGEKTGDEEDEIVWPKLEYSATAIDSCESNVPLKLEPPLYGRPHEVSASVNRWLRDYQRHGVQWMWKRIARNRGCILQDDMGLGKTVQICALFGALYGKSGRYSDKIKLRKKPYALPPSLVLTPTSLLYQWIGELKTWGCFEVRAFPKSRGDREELLQELTEKRVEIVLMSYDALRENAEFQKVKYECVVMDEFPCLKNSTGKRALAVRNVQTLKRIGLTGTIIQNNFNELWSLLDLVRPGLLGSKSYFRSTFAVPINTGQAQNATEGARQQAQERLVILRNHMRKFVLRRTKALLLDSLPDKKVFYAFCELSALQKRAYLRILASPEVQAIHRWFEGKHKPCHCGSGKSMKECKLRCRAPTKGLLWPKMHPEGVPCEMCPTCMSFPLYSLLELTSYHLELIKPVKLSQSEEDMSPDERFRRYVLDGMTSELNGLKRCSNQAKLGDTQYCGKLNIFTTLLRTLRKQRSKVLIFSFSTQLLDIIDACFKVENYAFVRLDGGMTRKKRNDAVEEFNSNPQCFAFLISTTAGGSGLNLVAADIVVNFDQSWNPALEAQSHDRAFRIGQTKDVTVYRFVSLGTIEQHMLMRQVYKTHLSKMVVDGNKEAQLFEGIDGNKDEQGKLFGIVNLLKYDPKLPRKLARRMTHQNDMQFGVVEVETPESEEKQEKWNMDGDISDDDSAPKVEEKKPSVAKPRAKKPVKRPPRAAQPKAKPTRKFAKEFKQLKEHAAFVAADPDDDPNASTKLDGTLSEDEFAPFARKKDPKPMIKRRKRRKKTGLRLV